MIVDTSALVAILFDESDAEYYLRMVTEAPHCSMSAASYLEATIVVERRLGALGGQELELFVNRTPIYLEPVTLDQAEAARRAWRRFGRGNHPARLNYGDCFAYALSKVSGEPLLFKGMDFARTDIEPA